jgi:hypothetical protein
MGEQLSPILRRTSEDRVAIWCPGCASSHVIDVSPAGWRWNGSADAPTFTPSLLVRSGHHLPDHDGGSCWCTYNAAHPSEPAPFTCGRCHSFLEDGKIRFLADCTHALAGQTVPLPAWPAEAP